jgi:23S rRNA (guanosine2251-2'-O)-methyltransferase
MSERLLYGFHPVLARLRQSPATVHEVLANSGRQDARMCDLVELAENAGVRVRLLPGEALNKLAGHARHQGVVARVEVVAMSHSLDDILDAATTPPLVLVLDGVTDPHNLGAILRSADAFGAHAVVAPKDRAAGLNATVEKVASGAAQLVPYLMVTNLSRTLGELKERNLWTVATVMETSTPLSAIDAKSGIAWVLGAEGSGLRRLTRETCDAAATIPMQGSVASLNVSVSAALCLYETQRQRTSR